MQYRVINNKLISSQFLTGGIFGLLMIMALPVIADGESGRYSVQNIAERSNPWALPQVQEGQQPYKQPYQQQPYNQYGQQYPAAPQYESGRTQQNNERVRQYRQPAHQWQPQTDRFVSPSFLESLKKQQQQYQVMPENNRYYQQAPRPAPQQVPRQAPGQYGQMQPESSLPGPGMYGYPSYGAGSVNPLFDAPAVSPWGDGADVLYRGESFPMIPNEAVGGLPPLHVPSFNMNNFSKDGSVQDDGSGVNNVFNPFTFLPD